MEEVNQNKAFILENSNGLLPRKEKWFFNKHKIVIL